ncbi:MAG: SHOCT domain-containing protein [Bradyrhizobium sp.]
MMGNGWKGTGWMMIFGGLFWLVLLGIGAAGAVWLFGAAQRRGRDVPMAERNYPALEVLEQRYARGEINREEYLGKKSDMLRPGRAAPAP